MNRRKFLKNAACITAGGISGVFALDQKAFGAQAEARLNGSKYRGNRKGQILESTDGGFTWEVCADFGPQIAFLHIFKFKKQLYAWGTYLRKPFFLKSGDGRCWYTYGWEAPT